VLTTHFARCILYVVLLIVKQTNKLRKEMEMAKNLAATQPMISIKVRRVNEVANQIQATGEYPKVVKKLHSGVLKAVERKQDHITMYYDEWQSCLNLTK